MCPEVDSASENTRDFSWGKEGRCVWLTNYHPCSAETSRKSGALIYPESLGPPRPVAGHLYFTMYTLMSLFIYSCQLHAQVLILQAKSHICPEYLNLLMQKMKKRRSICMVLGNSEVPDLIWLRLAGNKRLESQASWFNIIFEFLVVMLQKIQFFWNFAPCRLGNIYWHFGRM